MQKINLFLFVALLGAMLIGCQGAKNWEYKVVYFDADKIQSADKNYTSGSDAFNSSVSSSTILPDESSLNKEGKNGWELATSYLELETVYPNLLAKGDGVNGLQPNIRPQRLVVIFKRPLPAK